jgi:S-adenosylmethionine hydrolase
MIVLFTDFGVSGPYVGQVKAVLARQAPATPVVDLMHDAPAWDAKRASYLLAATIAAFPNDAVFLCVVDPGVGGDRAAIVVEADGRHFVGPDNGLFEMVSRRADRGAAREISWRPAALSSSFHGRDLFAPVAAMIARGETVPGTTIALDAVRRPDWPDDLDEVVYIDAFGNVMTGRRANTVPETMVVHAANRPIPRAATFSDVPSDAAFWYENSSGLVEIAVNRGRAADLLGLRIGDPIDMSD